MADVGGAVVVMREWCPIREFPAGQRTYRTIQCGSSTTGTCIPVDSPVAFGHREMPGQRIAGVEMAEMHELGPDTRTRRAEPSHRFGRRRAILATEIGRAHV